MKDAFKQGSRARNPEIKKSLAEEPQMKRVNSTNLNSKKQNELANLTRGRYGSRDVQDDSGSDGVTQVHGRRWRDTGRVW